MRKAIRAAIEQSGHTHAYIAAELDVTEQAITGWLRTGRIDKRRLPALARITGVPLSTFMPDAGNGESFRVESEAPPPYGDLPPARRRSVAAETLWAAYSQASPEIQHAVDLLLLDPTTRNQAVEGNPALVAGIELLELHAAQALAHAAQKTA
nr:hypothetical protein BGP89_11280 [Luteimonas sp. JM171]